MDDQQGMAKNVCACSHHKVVPCLLIIVGLAFLLESLGILGSGVSGIIWPLALIIAGGTKLGSNKCKCC